LRDVASELEKLVGGSSRRSDAARDALKPGGNGKSMLADSAATATSHGGGNGHLPNVKSDRLLTAKSARKLEAAAYHPH